MIVRPDMVRSGDILQVYHYVALVLRTTNVWPWPGTAWSGVDERDYVSFYIVNLSTGEQDRWTFQKDDDMVRIVRHAP